MQPDASAALAWVDTERDPSRYAEELGTSGFSIMRAAIDPETIDAIDHELADDFAETPLCQGGFYGDRTQRFGHLLTRSNHVAELVLHPTILSLATAVLGPFCDTLQLNLTQAIALYPSALAQLPHRDQDMWRGEIGHVEYLVNVMWPLTPYDDQNGATLVWPGSHGARALSPDEPNDPIVAAMDPGDALVFLGSTLHGAGANTSATVRRGIIVSYCLGWLKPYENQWLVYPPSIARDFAPELARLVGYQQHRPNLGNFEGRCPSILLGEDVPARIGAIDALRPDQEELLAAYVAGQRRRA